MDETSLQDLTLSQVIEAYHQIASKLEMTYEDFVSLGKVTNVEIGYNIPINTRCSTIVKNLVKYGKIENRKEVGEHETVYFLGDDKTIKVYDKCLETAVNSTYISKHKKVALIGRLLDNTRNYIRIEVKLKNTKSFRRYGLNGIHTIQDLLKNYNISSHSSQS